ncbi:MAG: hypothetical protein AAFU03_07630, partial [Bacteroidota bacterium]
YSGSVSDPRDIYSDDDTGESTIGSSASNDFSDNRASYTEDYDRAGSDFDLDARYSVIVSTHREMRWAEATVEKLKKAGFPEARVAKMDRGTYAAAVAGTSNSYAEAKKLMARAAQNGYYDAYVKERN